MRKEMSGYYRSKSEIEAVVQGFEACTTGKGAFTHQSHLTVAVWYLQDSTEEQAMEKMRMGLHRFLDHLGVGQEKYHETLTVFWIKIVRNCLQRLDPRFSLLEMTNAVIESLGNSRLVFEYYTKELLGSVSAKNGWVEPDLKDLRKHSSSQLAN
jgi:hypothetical protein